MTAQRNGGTADTFGYDLNRQLTSFQPGGGALTSYALDANGNRTTAGGKSYVSNYLNQYTSVGGKTATYDNNGNVLSRYDASGTQWTYTYDAMNRLTQATSGSVTRNFYYDGLNRQVARSGTALPSTFSVWDGWELVAEYGYQASTPNRTLIHGMAGDLVAQVQSGAFSYYFPDGMGSTSYLADGSKNLIEQYTYDVYGTPTIANASGTVIGTSAYSADHFFTGRRWDGPIGLDDNRHRFYAPDSGRFLQPDPIGFAGDPANLYRYCGNNPANGSDPMGLEEQPEPPKKLGGGDYQLPDYYKTDPNYAPTGTRIPLPIGADLRSAGNFPEGFSSTNGWGSVSGALNVGEGSYSVTIGPITASGRQSGASSPSRGGSPTPNQQTATVTLGQITGEGFPPPSNPSGTGMFSEYTYSFYSGPGGTVGVQYVTLTNGDSAVYIVAGGGGGFFAGQSIQGGIIENAYDINSLAGFFVTADGSLGPGGVSGAYSPDTGTYIISGALNPNAAPSSFKVGAYGATTYSFPVSVSRAGGP